MHQANAIPPKLEFFSEKMNQIKGTRDQFLIEPAQFSVHFLLNFAYDQGFFLKKFIYQFRYKLKTPNINTARVITSVIKFSSNLILWGFLRSLCVISRFFGLQWHIGPRPKGLLSLHAFYSSGIGLRAWGVNDLQRTKPQVAQRDEPEIASVRRLRLCVH